MYFDYGNILWTINIQHKMCGIYEKSFTDF